jgi:3-methylcrotonyl-CoA carboxylase alpha subunit
VQSTVSAIVEPAALELFVDGEGWRLRLPDPLAPGDERIADGGKICAPIPATVRRVLVEPGDAVVRGQALLVLEAMKMELTLTAPADGTIAAVRAVVGQLVSEGEELVELEAVA